MKADLLTDWLIGLTQESSPFFSVYRFLIQTTIYLTVTGLFIILFKLLFKNRIRAKWHFLIWIILLIRLAVPILPSSPASVFNAAKIADDTIVQSSYYSYVDNNSSVAEGQDDNYTVAEGLQRMIEADQNKLSFDNSFEDNRTGVSDGSATSSGTFVPLSTIVVCIWLGGVVLLLLYFVIVYAFCIHRLKKQRSACGDNINAILDSCKGQLRVKRNVRIYHADTTPTLIGLFRPTIYLPDTYSEAELRNVLLHELCHMKHMDVLWSLLAVLILCMNWFNPIMWVCFFLFKRDIEVYCDERTLRYAEDKQSYAMLLLKTATSRKERFVLGTTSLQSGKADVKRRIRFMANFKKPSVALVLVAVVLVGIMTTACLTNSIGKDTSGTINDMADLLSTSIITDYESLYAGESFQVFHSKQSLDELRKAVMYQQPDDFSIVNYSDNEFTVNWWQGSDNILFSKEIYGVDGKRLDDTYVIASQQRSYRFGDDEIYYPYPYHMTQHSWTLSETADGYNLSYNFDPFESLIILKEGDSVFTDLIRYYENNSCEVTGYEGGNLTGGIIFVSLYPYSGESFRILVTRNGDTFSMRYGLINRAEAEYPETVIHDYMSATNENDADRFIQCFEEIDERVIDVFLNNVQSCSFQNAEIFWIDEEQEKYIFKVSYRLISEDGKTIGSYGTGKMDLIEYFTVSTNNTDHEPVIVNKFSSFADCAYALISDQE